MLVLHVPEQPPNTNAPLFENDGFAPDMVPPAHIIPRTRAGVTTRLAEHIITTSPVCTPARSRSPRPIFFTALRNSPALSDCEGSSASTNSGLSHPCFQSSFRCSAIRPAVKKLLSSPKTKERRSLLGMSTVHLDLKTIAKLQQVGRT